jgi:hypothetical protein
MSTTGQEPDGDSTRGSTGGSTEDEDTDVDDGYSFIVAVDLGSTEEDAAAYACDDPDAQLPPTEVCEDAIPGDEASDEDQAAAKAAFGELCRLERICGDQWGVDCGAAFDGFYFYVDAETLETIATCGGACHAGQCEDCPPAGWACPLY